jgi:hypothetical protein
MNAADDQTHLRVISRMRSCMRVFKDVCACQFPCLSLQTVECSRALMITSVLLISSHHHMQASIAKQSAALKKAPTEVPESRGLLRVTVIEAQNLPKLDLMRTSGMKRPHLRSWTLRLMPLAHTVN